jgi:hypothetical protein
MLDVSVAKVCCRSEETVMHDLIVVIAARDERIKAMYVRVVLIPNLLRFFCFCLYSYIMPLVQPDLHLVLIRPRNLMCAPNKKGTVWSLEHLTLNVAHDIPAFIFLYQAVRDFCFMPRTPL